MQAIILAGGLGTRLRSVVSDRPKPMALVEGKPFLEYVLQGLKKSGIDDIIFAVGYKGGMVEEYFGDGSRFGIRARYAYEEELLGTAGAIKNAGKYVTDEQFFVLNGDTFYQMDFGDLSRIQQEKNLEMALGMSAGDANAEGWRGSREATLLQQGEEGTGMALLLGGEAASTAAWETGLFWSFVGEYGYYWSASEVKDNGLQTATVWFRKIGAHYTTVYRGAVTLQRLMRVRCCRDAGK